ncbi:unnamed protein product [Candida verbasci]|uniref:C2H2-type domain-containing protein n=1 Tax=Candida verbasci TaxID=1227364 RepID=A0A9W4TW53_9ASCO|nr:unnamed protein product [Candida verbasci]
MDHQPSPPTTINSKNELTGNEDFPDVNDPIFKDDDTLSSNAANKSDLNNNVAIQFKNDEENNNTTILEDFKDDNNNDQGLTLENITTLSESDIKNNDFNYSDTRNKSKSIEQDHSMESLNNTDRNLPEMQSFQVSKSEENYSPYHQETPNNEFATPPPSNNSPVLSPIEQKINILINSNPLNIEEYANHLNKLGELLYDGDFDSIHLNNLHNKLTSLMNSLNNYLDPQSPLNNRLYLIIEKNFDILIKLSTNYKFVEISTLSIRYLTTVFMNLNYWEIYNLLTWKPSIYHFLKLIHFDLDECYQKFLKDYSNYSYDKVAQPIIKKRIRLTKRRRLDRLTDEEYFMHLTPEEREARSSQFFSLNPDTTDHDRYIADIVSGASKEKRRFRPDVKLEHHKIIKKPIPIIDKGSTKSSNYDPDVVHECQLPSAEEPHKLCLRRFSRKYELIRHQETVHSKKKKLFKCYVCVKQNPGIGPRIFTRHDTLAKHIRVNHKIGGKEAKAEVAYSKKHAEIVEEGDITVHVGRRKTKVDFELRAHMEKRKLSGDERYVETSDLDSGEEEFTYNNTQLDQI